MSCNKKQIDNAINKYTSIFEEIVTTEEALVLAKARVDELLNTKRSTPNNTGIDTTGITPEIISTETINRIFDDYLSKQTIPIDSPAHIEHLRGVLHETMKVLKDKGTLELFTKLNDGVTRGEIQGSVVAINIAENVQSTPIPMSPNEVLVHELTHAIFATALENPSNYGVIKEIERLWLQTKRHLNEKYNGNGYEVFLSNGSTNPAEIAAAKERFDYIFGSSAVTRKTETDEFGNTTTKIVGTNLHEFLAFGLTNASLINGMRGFNIREEKKDKPNTFTDRIYQIYRNILDWLVGSMYKTRGKRADIALRQLAKKLNQIEKKHKYNLDSVFERLDTMEEHTRSFIDRKLGQKLARWSWEKARRGDSTILSNTIGYINPSSHDNFKFVLNKLRRSNRIGANTFIGQLFKEATVGEDRVIEKLIYRSKNLTERAAQVEHDVVSKATREAFVTSIDNQEARALTVVMLKADLSSLIDRYSIDDINKLLSDEKYLNTAIGTIVNNLPAQYRNYYTNQARSLGKFMATGYFRIHDTKPNAFAIAMGVSNNTVEISPTVVKDVVMDIDKLITLYAIQYTSKDAKKLASKTISKEQRKSKDNNGISFILSMHDNFKGQSLEKNFDGNPMQMNKGFIEDIYDPHIELKIVPKKDVREMEKSGYKRVTNKNLQKAVNDNNSESYVLMIHRFAGLDNRVKAAFSIVDEHSQGTDLISKFSSIEGMSYKDAIDYINTIRAKNARYHDLANGSINHEDSGVILKPILDPTGNIANYSYVMPFAERSMLLNQELEIDNVMATMYSRSINKKNSKTINREVIEFLRKDYVDNYKRNSKDYVLISRDSKDEELKEIYNLLPDYIKNELYDNFGVRGIYIRRDYIVPIFAYRKLSMFNNKYVNNWVLRVVEAIWKEIIGIAKSSIVIRTFTVLRDNIISNVSALVLSGVPIDKAFKYQLEGVRGIHLFLADEKRARELEFKLNNTNDSTEKSQIRAEINTIRNTIRNNPIYPLIEANMFNTIAEDLNTTTSDYSYLNRFYEYFRPKKEHKAWDRVEDLASQAYMGKNTMGFQLLLKSTQYSDFVARYAMYKHGMEKINAKKLSPSAKKIEVEELFTKMWRMFIAYDIPTSKQLDYANDTGIALFTRYPLRISRALFSLIRERPATVMSSLLLGYILGIDVPDPTDTTILSSSLLAVPTDVASNAFQLHGLEHMHDLVN